MNKLSPQLAKGKRIIIGSEINEIENGKRIEKNQQNWKLYFEDKIDKTLAILKERSRERNSK